MGDIYLFKMLILLIKMHIYVLNQKSKGYKGKVALSQNEWVTLKKIKNKNDRITPPSRFACHLRQTC